MSLARACGVAVEAGGYWASAVNVPLHAGQASFHHGHNFHASGPNTTHARRVGVAIRYVVPSMKQISGDKLLVSHVSGEDRHGHFEHIPATAGRLLTEDWGGRGVTRTRNAKYSTRASNPSWSRRIAGADKLRGGGDNC